MSLKTDYGLSAALNGAFDDGVTYIGTLASPGVAYPTLSTELIAASALGKESFIVQVAVPAAVRTAILLQGKFWSAYKAGILSALAEEDVYNYELTLTLNTSDSSDTYIDFNFTF